MPDIDWKRAYEIYSEAMDVAADDRHDLVRRVARDDVPLRDAVISLLDIEEDAASFMEESIGNVYSLEDQIFNTLVKPGTLIGKYVIERWLGGGGMGDVYLARRADGVFEQLVALKLLRHGGDEEWRERFNRERMFLGRFHHPNIAQIYDGGVTEETSILSGGTPYLVMEYVEGVPIDVYCDTHALDIRARIKLFLNLCSAVSNAHTLGLLHRDIKPHNVLVTSSGVLKLIDFGVAKPLKERESTVEPNPNLPAFFTQKALMTPEYASPEQVRGLPLKPASDVYAMGVMLYRLLTGHSPYGATTSEKKSTDLKNDLQVVVNHIPAPASAIVQNDRVADTEQGTRETTTANELGRLRASNPLDLEKVLRGDLDDILHKALSKDPGSRYQTVSAFEQDLRAFLKHEPVHARLEHFRAENLYNQAQKNLYHGSKWLRRNPALAVSVSALVVLLITGSILVTLWYQNEQNNQDLMSTSNLLFEMFDQVDPHEVRYQDVTAQKLLEGVVARARVNFSGQPHRLAIVFQQVGSLYQKLGLYRTAVDLHKEALVNLPSSETETRIMVMYGLGQSLMYADAYKEGEQVLLDALELAENELPKKHEQTLKIMYSLATLYRQSSRYEESLTYAKRARQFSPTDEMALDLDENNAIVFRRQGKLDEAERILKEVLSKRRKDRAESPDIATTLSNLGVVYNEQYSISREEVYLAKAETMFRESIRMYRLFFPEHPSIGRTLSMLSGVLQTRGDLVGAEEAITSTIELHKKIVGDSHSRLVLPLINLSVIQKAQGKMEETEQTLRRALWIAQNRLGQHENTAMVYYNLGYFLRDKNPAEALELFNNSLAMYKEVASKDHKWAIASVVQIGRIYINQDLPIQAEPYLREALTIRRNTLKPNNWRIPSGESMLGWCLVKMGAWEEGLQLLQVGYEGLAEILGEDSAKAREAQQRYQDALSTSLAP